MDQKRYPSRMRKFETSQHARGKDKRTELDNLRYARLLQFEDQVSYITALKFGIPDVANKPEALQ